MNTYYYDDQSFKNTSLYQDFNKENPVKGNLRIRAYAANQAIPVSGIKIIISLIYQNNKIVFFEGVTNDSGIIERISLPAPRLVADNLLAPNKLTYDIDATYEPDNLNQKYKINIYEDICVVQNINIVPETTFAGEFIWL